MRVVGRSLLAYSRSKESATEKLHAAPAFLSKPDSRIFIVLLRGKSEGGRTTATNKPTERNKELSAIVLIQPAASGDKLSLDGAANQFCCLHQQTRPVLGEIPPARNLGFQPAVSLHRPGSDLDQHRNPRDRKDPAPGGWGPAAIMASSSRRAFIG
jgi:hypothetical protein